MSVRLAVDLSAVEMIRGRGGAAGSGIDPPLGVVSFPPEIVVPVRQTAPEADDDAVPE